MNIDRFTEKSQQAIAAAHEIAEENGHQRVDVAHLLSAMLNQEQGLCTSILRKADVDPSSLAQKVNQVIRNQPRVSGPGGSQLSIASGLQRVLSQSEKEAKQFKDEFISIEHLLLAIVGEDDAIGRLIRNEGITRDRLMKALQEVRVIVFRMAGKKYKDVNG